MKKPALVYLVQGDLIHLGSAKDPKHPALDSTAHRILTGLADEGHSCG